MPSEKSGRKPATQSVPTRRSHRQERIAKRHPERDLGRSYTGGRGRSGTPWMLISTGLSIVVGLAVIAFAAFNNASVVGPSAIHQPAFQTSSDIAQTGQTLGNGPVKVVLYADFQCPGCGEAVRTFEERLVNNYVKTGKITLTHNDLIVNDGKIAGNTESADAANAARCAADQGKFWQYHDWLYFNQQPEWSGGYTQDRLVEIGRQMNLDMSKFEPCVRNRTHVAEARAAGSSWNTAWGNPSTPTFVVAGQRVAASYDSISRAIDDALTATPAPPVSASPSTAPTASPTVTPAAS